MYATVFHVYTTLNRQDASRTLTQRLPFTRTSEPFAQSLEPTNTSTLSSAGLSSSMIAPGLRFAICWAHIHRLPRSILSFAGPMSASMSFFHIFAFLNSRHPHVERIMVVVSLPRPRRGVHAIKLACLGASDPLFSHA